MNAEDRFVAILAIAESSDNPIAWGDSGLAAGRWQQHPSFYASWGPRARDFGGVERSWDWCFEFAVRRFYRAAIFDRPAAKPEMIAMAYHLHGQVIWSGWDSPYFERWTVGEDRINSENGGI